MKKRLFFALLLTYSSHWIIEYYYPVQAVLAKNKVLSFFGLEDEIKLPSKKKLTAQISFPRMENFTIYGGIENGLAKFALKGSQLDFKNQKILFFYASFLKKRFIQDASLKFRTKDNKTIHCMADKAFADKKFDKFSFRQNVNCEIDGKVTYLSKFILEREPGVLWLYPPLSKPKKVL